MTPQAVRDAHVVCVVCGTRWTVPYQEGRTSPPTPRECKNSECDAGWLDLPVFMDEADAPPVVTMARRRP